MKKITKTEEFNFLEEYFKFYSKKNGANIGGFIAFAQSTLVNTEQISEESLAAFETTYHLNLELEKKNKQIKILENEVEDLKKQINKNASTTIHIIHDDGCGKSVSSRGKC